MSNPTVFTPSRRDGTACTLAGLLASFLVIVAALAADTALLLGSIDGTLPITHAASGVTVAVAPLAL